MITTTLNINDAALLKLRGTSESLGITTSILVRKLLRNLNKSSSKKIKTFTAVRYQKTGESLHWKTFHLRLSPQLYEKCIDARKLFKCSVSLLLAMEIEENLDKIIREIILRGDVDNYHETYLIFHQRSVYGHNYQVYNGKKEANRNKARQRK